MTEREKRLLEALKSARQWVRLIVDAADIDPEDTTVTARASGSESVIAVFNLAESQKQWDETIAEVES